MKVVLLIGITLILCVGMILICTFLSGKSKKMIDKLKGYTKKED